MRSWCDARGRSGHGIFPKSDAAFSLIELMVAMTILSLLILLSVPTYQKIQRRAKVAVLANDFRTFATALQSHAHEVGSWPLETAAGVVPTGMTPEELKDDDWTHPTPIGGKFDWEYKQTHGGTQYLAAIAITDTSDAPLTIDAELLLDLDKAIDDGDLTTGNLIMGFGGSPLFIIEK